MAKGIALRLGAAFLVLMPAAPAGAMRIDVSWDMLSGGSPVTEHGKGFKNRLVFDEAGHRLIADGWFMDGRRGRFRSGHTGRYAGGLGICQRKANGRNCDRDGSVNPVDNAAEPDWLLLSLDGEYQLQTLELLPAVAGDLQLSYWVGTVPADTRMKRLGYADLAAAGFGPRRDVRIAAGEPPVLDFGGALGNAVLIGGGFGGSADAFFVQRLTVRQPVVPLPPAALAFGSALCLLACVRLRGPGARRQPA